jgi:hypothetical protein
MHNSKHSSKNSSKHTSKHSQTSSSQGKGTRARKNSSKQLKFLW